MSLTLTQTSRPKFIKDVAGQKDAKLCLTSIVKQPERSPRVLILYGPYGTGKTSLARAFARALNCLNPVDGDACGYCENCQNNLDNIPYYDEYDSSVIGNVDSIRQMKEYFDYNGTGYRVIVLDEAQLMSRQAQSTLLKTFEEVSSNIFFVLCTTNREQLINTIHSRSMSIRLDLISRDEVAKNIRETAEKNNIEITDRDIEDIVKKSKGHLRDAHILLQSYSLLDKETYLRTTESLRDLILLFFQVCCQKRKEFLGQAITRILNYPLAEVKSEFEEVVGDIFENLTAPRADLSNDTALASTVHMLRGKTIILYRILCDKLVYNSFENDNLAKAIFYIIYEQMEVI